ncbi:ATP-dependent Lhr-like helicase [Hasllibacter halocynthiae]|uniref:ATP-dependent Lhr-like helicase n=1 Tax=Hasllibacter halocynthiae TaxID=595589 RepID=A0A2T0X9K6_9RHOB|nr:ligase-associated DNA damage response DEXH box helicase [Hasllibacter halocynthiae]PRY95632.1 ATP-dependent Lhr-like helicase [Hasllibacter halocynthiae]
MLPERFATWFADRGWSIHPHQQEMLERKDDPALLLIAPTGGGKTLAGFLPTLVELEDGAHEGIHTIYVSPLKALANDIKRNLATPIAEMALPIRVEDRTGDTSQTRRKRQRADPPHVLLTTPESLALLLSYEDAPRIFRGLRRVIVDEIHALAENKRGDQLMLLLGRLQTLVPGMRRVGLSATVEDPEAMADRLRFHPDPCTIVLADPGPEPDIAMLTSPDPPPWAGGGGRYAIPAILDEVRRHTTTLIFHNTRAQAEIFFHALWLANEDDLPIGIHHGSLSREQRQRVEAAMAEGELRAIVCTASLDLGIDWGDVDLVIQIGAPKNVKRLVQRIGRANHRYNAPSKALLVPANRFEVLECVAALDAVRERDLDGIPPGPGGRDVLCQHILLTAAAGPFDADALYGEVHRTGCYTHVTRPEFDACLHFTATGGYALRAYDRYQRIREIAPGRWALRDPRQARRIRINLGTIMDTDVMKVRLKNRLGGAPLGEVEEGFANSLVPGDTFLMAGRVVRYVNTRELTVEVTRNPSKEPRIATYIGLKFATSTELVDRVYDILHHGHPDLPAHTVGWLALQKRRSHLPTRDRILVESFEMDAREHTAIYAFAGRNAMQTLGILLTKRMEEAGLDPLGFVATDYALGIWGLERLRDPAPLFTLENLQDGLDRWLNQNQLMKRTFRKAATIAGLLDRNTAQGRRSGRQATFSSDILYDTLMKYEPDHLILDITREEAMRGLVDFARIEEMLSRTEGRVDHVELDRPSPFAAPLFLERGRVPVEGAGRERLIMEEAGALLEAAGLDPSGVPEKPYADAG